MLKVRRYTRSGTEVTGHQISMRDTILEETSSDKAGMAESSLARLSHTLWPSNDLMYGHISRFFFRLQRTLDYV